VCSSANATPEFEGRGGEDLATSISMMMYQTYRSCNGLNLSSLCIVPRQKCWCLYVDILVYCFYIILTDNYIISKGHRGWREQEWFCGWEVPGCFFWVLPKRSIPKPDPHRKDIIQQESLGTDML